MERNDSDSISIDFIVQESGISVFNVDGYYWYAGINEDSVVELFLEDTEFEKSDIPVGYPIKLTDDHLNTITLIKNDDSEVSFKIGLYELIQQKVEFPVFFATTEI